MFTDCGLDLPCKRAWGQGTVIIRKTFPERFSEVWEVHFDTSDRCYLEIHVTWISKTVLNLSFLSVHKHSPTVLWFWFWFPSPRTPYLKPVRVLESMCSKRCPLSTYCFLWMSDLCQLLILLMLLLPLCNMQMHCVQLPNWQLLYWFLYQQFHTNRAVGMNLVNCSAVMSGSSYLRRWKQQ